MELGQSPWWRPSGHQAYGLPGGILESVEERREPVFLTVSLDPNATIEAYKTDVDRTLLRENLRLTTTERVRKMTAALRFAETVRTSRVKTGAT